MWRIQLWTLRYQLISPKQEKRTPFKNKYLNDSQIELDMNIVFLLFFRSQLRTFVWIIGRQFFWCSKFFKRHHADKILFVFFGYFVTCFYSNKNNNDKNLTENVTANNLKYWAIFVFVYQFDLGSISSRTFFFES